MIGRSDEIEELFPHSFPVVKELLVGLIMGFDLQDLKEFCDADVVRHVGLQPLAVDAMALDE